jgi:hypothetical protein
LWLASVVWVLSATAGAVPAAAPASESAEVQAMAREVRLSRDSAGQPFAIVDKRNAQLAVYDARGRLAGVSAALLGLMPGDHSAPDAARKLAQGRLGAAERTTPAGRYVAVSGLNLNGERVVWFDYAQALAIHRLRPAPPHERRAERLASPSPDDNRITLGCVVVEAAFFDAVVLPLLGRGPRLVYVLRDELPQP